MNSKKEAFIYGWTSVWRRPEWVSGTREMFELYGNDLDGINHFVFWEQAGLASLFLSTMLLILSGLVLVMTNVSEIGGTILVLLGVVLFTTCPIYAWRRFAKKESR